MLSLFYPQNTSTASHKADPPLHKWSNNIVPPLSTFSLQEWYNTDHSTFLQLISDHRKFFPFFIINCKFKRLITDSIFIKISYYINPGQPTHLWDKILCSAHTLCIWRIIISICAITFAPKKSCARYPGQNANSTMIKSTVAIPILILFFIIFLFCFLLIFLLFLCEYK